jgi:hypothetical protein
LSSDTLVVSRASSLSSSSTCGTSKTDGSEHTVPVHAELPTSCCKETLLGGAAALVIVAEEQGKVSGATMVRGHCTGRPIQAAALVNAGALWCAAAGAARWARRGCFASNFH